MSDVRTAAKLLDFGARIGVGQRSQEQLEGAVAIHNILAKRGVAYLADEVGMGKTYVALGALALFRHFQPDFSVLIIAPRENIQNKWMKELRNFVEHNVRSPDLRVKALDGRPCRPLVACANLLDLVQEVTINPHRDFFLRLTSFSVPVAGKDSVDPEAARRLRDGLRRYLPWLKDEIFDLRNRQAFKDSVAKALCCALPTFDLVIVDEGHNLKHGFGERVSARNRVLALAMGHPGVEVDPRLFPRYGARAKRVLFLSATPVEETYRHLWNQLDIFGLSKPFDGLRKGELEEDEKKAIAGQFLIRRVTAIRVNNVEYTKNLYRREWRRGGVRVHDEPIHIEDPKQRLIVALVQKKVSELLGHERFNSSFQVGMLASFESFLETTKLQRDDVDIGNFDDADQTENVLEREGIDVSDVNKLAKSYRRKFGTEMPHPKMDAIVDSLSSAWLRGEKALIFVRRVASVKELKKKLDERYDAWLVAKLQRELPAVVQTRLKRVFSQYRAEQLEAESKARPTDSAERVGELANEQDSGGKDSFFAWFFRGQGPRGVVSGANIQQRFIQRTSAYATFFEHNYLTDVLACRPEQVEKGLAEALRLDAGRLMTLLREQSNRFLSSARQHARADRFEAVQGAALECLKDQAGPYQESARIIWHERFEASVRISPATDAPEIGDLLAQPTFFTELVNREELRARLWPKSKHVDVKQAFRERELRAQILSSAARLGHSLIDLYIMTICRLGSLERGAQESTDDGGGDLEIARITEYLDLLERQMHTPRATREWGAFDELSDIAANFNLILDVNEPEAGRKHLQEVARLFGQLLRQQQPVGGMSGQINQTLVRQFRMPGYPLVLVTTDLLQEGEDLHTFCSSVHHYGISWTPSSMEQRIGRIDRVRSQTELRLAAIRDRSVRGEEMLQVYFPHLEDTVEVLQVRRVLERMNVFLRLMHEGLTTSVGGERSIDANKEFARERRLVPQIIGRLESAFPVRPEHLVGGMLKVAVDFDTTWKLQKRFARLARLTLPGVDILWEPQSEPGVLLGTAKLRSRVQPFSLLLRSVEAHALVRCVSPVGCIRPGDDQDAVVASTSVSPIRIGAIVTKEERSYDLTVEGDVLLADSDETDATRVSMLINRVVQHADMLEQEYLPGQDEVLTAFREELLEESYGGR